MIRRLEVLHYKSLKYINIPLKPFQIVVGPNASGKSSFFDVICFLRDILKDDVQKAVQKRVSNFEELVWNREGKQFEVVMEINIPEEKSKKLKTKYNGVRYEISLQLDDNDGVVIKDENLFLIKDIEDQESNEKPEQLDLFPREIEEPEHIVFQKGKRTPQGWRKIIAKNISGGNTYIRSETTDWNMAYKINPYKTSLTAIPEDEERFPVSLWVKDVLSEGIQFLQLNSTAMRSSCRPDAPVYFQMDGSNLPKVIQNLKQKEPDKFTLWLEHIQSALPDIQDIQVKEKMEDRSPYLNIVYRNGLELPSWVISDGTLRLLTLTLIAYLPEKDKIYMIEEPENGLHPLAIETIYQSLSSVYKNQVFLATHSTAILRLAKIEDILCFAKTKSGYVDVIRGERHPKLKDWQRNVDIASLHASGVLH